MYTDKHGGNCELFIIKKQNGIDTFNSIGNTR